MAEVVDLAHVVVGLDDPLGELGSWSLSRKSVAIVETLLV